ncbi:pantothenate synthetase [Palleronia marisminoris]|uniref:Pantothenate synthetase n=1 Tax=Palleronia marisminoris TaxID=315423 RepID=A0A1Y5T805_9RHOB|nr:pantoate--beta-alanine ligase [Palleronia marisminoris]SFH17409.1 pantothenate synthetase [Palleronia marisminoris]SLN56018.1 Pantothenate synthetase [Palleronia marisminoris]
MEICRTKAALREARARLGDEGAQVGLVPTMGYLHEGHLTLIRRAKAETDRVVVSIFVNPTQFGPTEDFDAYPRDEARDFTLLEDEGVDAVFAPDPSEMYDPEAETAVEPTNLSRILIGRLRPGHFRGVATVVTKLLNLVQPSHAYFGRKDYQQLAVIRRVVRDLDVPVEIVGVDIVREADGLAMSSRNVRLTEEHRAAAPALHDALQEGRAAIEGGRTVKSARKIIRRVLQGAQGGEISSIDIRDADGLAQVTGRPEGPVVILLAVRFGSVLLIDNMVADPREAA